MSKLWKSVFGLCVIGMGLGVSASAQAATAVGPYYAMPAWDQKLDAATRFVVLSNWNSEAVLDRETGLVWEKVSTGVENWSFARQHCNGRTTGGRKGWRLPSVHELASLVDPANSNPALPTGHPFIAVQSVFHWSATLVALGGGGRAWGVSFADGSVSSDGVVQDRQVWCVRGGMNADQY